MYDAEVSFLSTFIILTSIEHYAQGSDTQCAMDTVSRPIRGSKGLQVTNKRLRVILYRRCSNSFSVCEQPGGDAGKNDSDLILI